MSAEKIYDEPLGSSGRSPQKSFLGRYGPASYIYIYIYIIYIKRARGRVCGRERAYACMLWCGRGRIKLGPTGYDLGQMAIGATVGLGFGLRAPKMGLEGRYGIDCLTRYSILSSLELISSSITEVRCRISWLFCK